MFQTIEDLKNTLADIDTARKQVSDTVSAYSQTQSNIQTYIDNLTAIEAVLNKIISLFKNNKVVIAQQAADAVANFQASCGDVVKHINSELDVVANSFSKNIDLDLKAISKQVVELDNVIKNAKSLTQTIDKTSQEIKNLVLSIKDLQQDLESSQKNQDIALARIEQGLDTLSYNMHQEATGIQKSIDGLQSVCSEISKQIANNRSVFEHRFADLTKEQQNTRNSITKEIKRNRYIEISISILLILAIIFAL